MSIIFFVLVIGWGMIGSDGPAPANSKTQKVREGSAESSEGSSAAPAGGTVGPVPSTDGKTGGGEPSDGSSK